MTRLVDHALDVTSNNGTERLAFCIAYGLFEFALKECLPVRSDRYGHALPNWPAFEQRQMNLPDDDPALVAAVTRVLRRPPQVEFAIDGRARFQAEPLPRGKHRAICAALRRIRNNLFHGGKTPYNTNDAEFVKAGLTILEGYLAINLDLADAFARGIK